MSWVGDVLMAIHNWYHGIAKHKAALERDDHPLRIGILSAAAINPSAIIDPVQTHPGAVITGIAARQIERAQAQITRHNLTSAKAYGSYDELLGDPTIQAVYIPLPNGLHAEWALKALEAGKHVLIEKPFTSNAEQARRIRLAAEKHDRVVVEAFHWRFHPAAHRTKEIIESGTYGAPTSIFAQMSIPGGAIKQDDIRYQYSIGGGAAMDLTYVFSASSYFATPDPTQAKVNVLSAVPRIHKSDDHVDEAMEATFELTAPDVGRPAVKCHVKVDLNLAPFLGFIPRVWALTPNVSVELEKARVDLSNFVLPAYGHAITITEKDAGGNLTGKKHSESVYVKGPQWGEKGQPWWTTYRYQLEAFTDAVRAKEAKKEYAGPWMSLQESESLMELIDSVYLKAGLPKRGE